MTKAHSWQVSGDWQQHGHKQKFISLCSFTEKFSLSLVGVEFHKLHGWYSDSEPKSKVHMPEESYWRSSA
jgi:hypothetical protein